MFSIPSPAYLSSNASKTFRLFLFLLGAACRMLYDKSNIHRILVEIVLWRALLLNLLPIQMTFEGHNFDALNGLLAIPVAMIIKKKWSPGISLAYNIIGLLLLLNILVIAVLSMPTPIRCFMNEPANTLVGEFPFIYLPAVLVVTAYSLHIFSLRQIWLLRKN